MRSTKICRSASVSFGLGFDLVGIEPLMHKLQSPSALA
jgi:hypothetical protein